MKKINEKECTLVIFFSCLFFTEGILPIGSCCLNSLQVIGSMQSVQDALFQITCRLRDAMFPVKPHVSTIAPPHFPPYSEVPSPSFRPRHDPASPSYHSPVGYPHGMKRT